ncbi:hypothetical protein BOX15_Mlig029130g3 [Macrostomum lignano]|uniref:BEACH domain-containing protein n=1 Tax=Macrostomum lignano TaxID=282301 RepID=A0A267EA61_9PLAT|nr:hypothetical protein BOX15_Mlig029130g3 [Macrostomum lignano]
MLARALAHPRCQLGRRGLALLLNAAASETVALPDCGGAIVSGHSAVLRCPPLVRDVLLCWDLWDRLSDELLDLLLDGLLSFLAPANPHRLLNANRLQRLGTVRSLLFACADRVLSGGLGGGSGGSGGRLPSGRAVDRLAALLSACIGRPASFPDLACLCNCVLLLHPPASTYVCFDANKFYFSLRPFSGGGAGAPSDDVIVGASLSAGSASRSSRSASAESSAAAAATAALATAGSHGNGNNSSNNNNNNNDNGADSSGDSEGGDDSDGGVADSPSFGERPEQQQQPDVLEGTATSRQERELFRKFYAENTAPEEAEDGDGDGENGEDGEGEGEGDGEGEMAAGMAAASPDVAEDATGSQLTAEQPPAAAIIEESQQQQQLQQKQKKKEKQKSSKSSTLVSDRAAQGDSAAPHRLLGALIGLVTEIVRGLADTQLEQVLSHGLSLESILALALHPSAEVRVRVAQLFAVYATRAAQARSLSSRLADLKAFVLTGNQLRQFPASQQLWSVAAGLVLGSSAPVPVDQPCEALAAFWKRPATSLQRRSVPLLLSLLEQSAHSGRMFYYGVSLIRQLLHNSGPEWTGLMIESGLVEAIVNGLCAFYSGAAVPAAASTSSADESADADDADDVESANFSLRVLGEVELAMASVAAHLFYSPDPMHSRLFDDLLRLFASLDARMIGRHGCASEAGEAPRHVLLHMLLAVLHRLFASSGRPAAELMPFEQQLAGKRSSLQLAESLNPLQFVESQKLRDLAAIAEAVTASSELTLSMTASTSSVTQQQQQQFTASGVTNPVDMQSSTSAASASLLSFGGGSGGVGGGGSVSETGRTAELSARLRRLLPAVIDTLILLPPLEGRLTHSVRLAAVFERSVFELLLRGLSECLAKRRPVQWHQLMLQSRDVLKVQLYRLLVHLVSPASAPEQRLFAVHTLAAENRARDLLRLCCLASGQAVASADWGPAAGLSNLYGLLSDMLGLPDLQYSSVRDDLVNLLNVLREAGAESADPAARADARRAWQLGQAEAAQAFASARQSSLEAWMARLRAEAGKLSHLAMDVTRLVVAAQNAQRKRLLDDMKVRLASNVDVKRRWLNLATQLTHEQAVWHRPSSDVPPSWQIDPTEGPSRVRVRLKRCHTGLAAKFFKQSAKWKATWDPAAGPLAFLFREDRLTEDASATLFQLHRNDKIRLNRRCLSVAASAETPGEFLIGERCMYFVGDDTVWDASQAQADSSGDAPQSASWSFDEVKEVHLRRYELRDNALEIFLASGAAYLLAFQSPRDRDEVARVVDGLELDSRVRQLTVDEAQRQWVTGQMSNFEYLAFLNTASGRSYNDLMQYPVFPWVLADYDSAELDLTQPATFRDLARPIGTQDDSAVARHRDKYEVLDRQYRELGPDHATPPYHYSSHYSNSGTVLHYLVRLPPYTQLFTVYQDRHFDLPDRTFHSIRTSWRLSSKLSDSDVKELIPEFFCLPEFLINSEELDFGVKQSGVRVDNVELPPWAADDPRRFVLIHRAALESPLVTEKLHKWIDLIFGYKQTGKAALSSVNLFHPYTYFGAIDLDQIDDPVRRRAIETMIKTYGQTPKQLFRSPHQPPVAAAPRSGRVPGAFGVRFGNYCGSPDCQAPPQVAWCEQLAAPVAQLVLNPSPVGPSAPEVLGLCPGTCALAGGQLLVGAADNVFRWRPAPTSASASAGAGQALGAPPPDWLGDRVTAAAACGWRVFCGLRSGLLRVFSVAASSTGSAAPASSSASGARGRAGGRIDWLGEAPVPLLGHRSAVTAAHACPEFALLATGDAAGRVLLWDTNQVAYVRCLRPSGPPVVALTASPTLADVAVLGQGQGSQLTVYTANGALVGSVSSGGGGGGGDRITCSVYSSLPEGRFINCLAVGLSSGCVRLLNSWDLGDLAFIRPGLASPAPLLALAFSRDCRRLYVSDRDNRVFVLEAPVDPYLSGGGGSGVGGGGGGGGMGQKTSKQQFAAFL